jgi:hypothetical protein
MTKHIIIIRGGGSPRRRTDESGRGRSGELRTGQGRWLRYGIEEEGGDSAALRKKLGTTRHRRRRRRQRDWVGEEVRDGDIDRVRVGNNCDIEAKAGSGVEGGNSDIEGGGGVEGSADGKIVQPDSAKSISIRIRVLRCGCYSFYTQDFIGIG